MLLHRVLLENVLPMPTRLTATCDLLRIFLSESYTLEKYKYDKEFPDQQAFRYMYS